MGQDGGLDETIKRRDEQITRVIRSLRHLPVAEQVAILCMWMSVEEVDEMLSVLERTR